MSGVPQGSVFGPILFLIYMNGLPDPLQGDVLLFADDVKLISARANIDDLQHAWGWTVIGMRTSVATSLSVLLPYVP